MACTLLDTFAEPGCACRSCVGRNLASMELLIIISSILRRYHFVLEHPEKRVGAVHPPCTRASNALSLKFDTKEGFLRKPVECRVGIKRRTV